MIHVTCSHIPLTKAGHSTVFVFSGVGKDNPIEKDTKGKSSKHFEWKCNLLHRKFNQEGYVLSKNMGEPMVS